VEGPTPFHFIVRKFIDREYMLCYVLDEEHKFARHQTFLNLAFNKEYLPYVREVTEDKEKTILALKGFF